MSDYPGSVEHLRGIVRWLESELAGARDALAAAERRDAEEVARPRYWLSWARRPEGWPRVGELHDEACWRPGSPNLTTAQTRAALAEHGGRIQPCDVCRATVTP